MVGTPPKNPNTGKAKPLTEEQKRKKNERERGEDWSVAAQKVR